MLVARAGGVGVARDVPDAQEAAGYSRATVALMEGSKARGLGWESRYPLERGVAETLSILREAESPCGTGN